MLQAAPSDIVITGKRLVEAQQQCATGDCTPLRDAQATIALAETRFRDGAYLDAKHLLAAAISRNKGKAATDPKPVAALYEAYATVSLHEGDQQAYRSAVARQVRTLRDNLPADDSTVVAATTALGDMWLKLGEYRQAEATYRTVEEDAIAAGQERAALLAGMKRVWLAAALERPSEARRKLAELETRNLAQQPGFRTALQVLRLRIAAREADDEALTKLVGLVTRSQNDDPVLLWAPGFELDSAAAATEARAMARRFGGADPLRIRSTDLDAIQWADVGFWIRPDGRTAEAEVLRSSHGNPWTNLVIKQISGRRYAASAGASRDATDGVYKIQRFTRASTYATPTGSAIQRRIAKGGFEILDLTADTASKPPTAG
jgi:tetratricopeptide (TPR) repeat protein